MKNAYGRFAAMIATSMVVMYMLMYLHTFAISHVRYSDTRLYMTLIMGGGMIPVMLLYMISMYENARANAIVLAVAALLLVGGTVLVRTQILVGDASYMRGMIPHHSIAILTSERADIEDLRVRELADGIIEAQRREIKEMNWLLEDIRAHGKARTESDKSARPVPEFSGSPTATWEMP